MGTDGQFSCANTGSDAVPPGKCVFRRPKEAKRALGNKYTNWASTETAVQERVSALTPRCDARRFAHLIDPSIYEKYPGLQQSSTCYDLVSCMPKESCIGDNQCKDEYQWMKPRCERWQAANPTSNNCTSDGKSIK